jgi:hypothetical protein
MFNVLLTLSLYLPASTESTSMTIETRNHTLNTSHGLLAEEESGQGKLPLLLMHGNSSCCGVFFSPSNAGAARE